MAEHAVIVFFEYEGDDLGPLSEVEDRLEVAITNADVGEMDGHEIGVNLSDGSLYMYGPNAESLYSVIRPILESADCLRSVRANLRFGPPVDGTPERTEQIKK